MKVEKVVCCDPMEITTGLQMEENFYTAVSYGEVEMGYFLWRSKPALVVPRSTTRKANFELAALETKRSGWPVVARSTGGELTPQCESFFNVSIFLRRQEEQIGIQESYMIICSAILGWLNEMGVQGHCASINGAFCNGDFNVHVGGKKLAGTAQRWRKVRSELSGSDEKALLLHAVILCDGDVDHLLDVANRFYQACGVDPFIVKDKHVSLGQLLGENNPRFVEEKMQSFGRYMDQYIDSMAERCQYA